MSSLRKNNLTFLAGLLFLWASLFAFVAPLEAQNTGQAVYGESSQTVPRYRTWNGTSFDAEAPAQTAAATIQWVVVKRSPTSDERIMGSFSSSNVLHIQTWDGSSWTSNWNTTLGSSSTRKFDIAYENSSGDAIVVFSDTTSQLKYRKRVSGTWDSTNQNAGTALSSLSNWVIAESRPTNDDVFVAAVTDGSAVHALRWNGSANTWGDQIQTSASIANKDRLGLDIAFERASGDAFLIWGDPSNNIKYKEFTTSWQAETNAYASLPAKVNWLVAAYDPLSSSSKIAIGMVLDNTTVEFGAWNGSSPWVSQPSAIASRSSVQRVIDVAFEGGSGEALYIFSQSANSDQLAWRTWTSGGGFSVRARRSPSGAFR